MNRERRFRKDGILDEGQKKLLQMLAIPLIVIILIIVIVIADRAGGKEPETTTAPSNETMEPTQAPTMETVPETVETSPAETEPTDPYETDTLKRNTDPGIETLLQNYFTARKDADAELMNSLYGIEGLNEWQLEAERVRLWTNAKYMTDFKNLSIYVMDGLESGSWLVYATTDMKFRMVETLAPMIMYSYVTTDAEGNYLLVNNKDLTFEQTKFIEKANLSEGVRRLAADVNRGLQEALASDEELKSVYGILHSNSPVWGDEYQESMAEVNILTDEELEAREANETAESTEESTTEAQTTAPAETAAADPEPAAAETTAAES
ncbi:MAG: hypothetical protein ACRDBO_02550 [Lachnospiraceae bacterium]